MVNIAKTHFFFTRKQYKIGGWISLINPYPANVENKVSS